MIEFGVSVYQNLWNELLPTTATALADNFQGGAQSCLYYQYFFSEYINMFQTLKKLSIILTVQRTTPPQKFWKTWTKGPKQYGNPTHHKQVHTEKGTDRINRKGISFDGGHRKPSWERGERHGDCVAWRWQGRGMSQETGLIGATSANGTEEQRWASSIAFTAAGPPLIAVWAGKWSAQVLAVRMPVRDARGSWISELKPCSWEPERTSDWGLVPQKKGSHQMKKQQQFLPHDPQQRFCPILAGEHRAPSRNSF